MQEVIINKEPVELYKLLKFEGLCSSGGEAKAVIAEGLVSLNGAVETQKRKKVVSGDSVVFNDIELKVRLAES
ncbi:MAG: RNA-binding S4 domain-containing protein [Opitutaceae bacterium]